MKETDLDELFTAEEAAREVGVKPGAIYTWVSRGYLKPRGRRGRYKTFALDDVFAAEAARLRKHRKKSQAIGVMTATLFLEDLMHPFTGFW